MGVATEVVGDDDVLDRARELSATIAGYPRSGVRAIKSTVVRGRSAASGRDWFARVRGGLRVAATRHRLRPGCGEPQRSR